MVPSNRGLPIALFAATLTFACLDSPTNPLSPQTSEAAADTAGGISPVSVLTLAPGDDLRITFQSDGCFHHIRFGLLLVRDSLGARIVVTENPKGLAPGWRLQPNARIEIPELRRLENLLVFYRRNTVNGCTTVDRIAVESVELGVRRQESFVDGSCGTYEDDDLLPIPRLFPAVRVA